MRRALESAGEFQEETYAEERDIDSLVLCSALRPEGRPMTYIMDLLLNTFASAAVLAALTAFAGIFWRDIWRDVLAKWITSRVTYGFDRDIETLRSQLRKAEETFRSEIRANERRVGSVADVALGVLSGRQSALDARRLQAIEKLWAVKAKLDSAKLSAMVMAAMDFEAAAKLSAKDPEVRAFLKMLSEQSPINQLNKENQLPGLESERPFLSPVVWALYRAYSVALLLPILQLMFLSTGVAKSRPLNNKPANDVLRAALPEYAPLIDQAGSACHYRLIEPLEEKLLVATQDMLSGKEADAASLAQAADILKVASRFTTKTMDAELPAGLKLQEPPIGD